MYSRNKCMTCGKLFLLDMDFSHHWKKCVSEWVKNCENMRSNSIIEKNILSQSIQSPVIVMDNDDIPFTKPLTGFTRVIY